MADLYVWRLYKTIRTVEKYVKSGDVFEGGSQGWSFKAGQGHGKNYGGYTSWSLDKYGGFVESGSYVSDIETVPVGTALYNVVNNTNYRYQMTGDFIKSISEDGTVSGQKGGLTVHDESTYVKGAFDRTVIAEYNKYRPGLGRSRWTDYQSGGPGGYGWEPPYYYERGELYSSPPDMSFRINGAIKTYDDGWVRVDGQLKQIDTMWARVDGVLKKL